MLTLPDAIVPVLGPFATLFTNPTWQQGSTAAGRHHTGHGTAHRGRGAPRHGTQRRPDDYARYHEVLNRAVWSPREAARILLVLLLQYLDRGDGPLVFGIDETLERRRGAKIKARGIYRDAVRSSRHQLVKSSGLRWISLMWLGLVPWARRHWALPVLTVLAPSSRYYQRQGRRHKKITDWARQMVMQLRRWLPHRPLVLVGDNGYAVPVSRHGAGSRPPPLLPVSAPAGYPLIAGLRLDEALYAPAPPREPGQNGRPPLKGPRRPSLKSLLDQDHVPWTLAAVSWYDGTSRTLELASQTAVWYRSGKPAVHHPLGADPRSPRVPSILRRCSAPTRWQTLPRSWSGLCCVGNWRSPFRKSEPTWAWRPNASGPTWPSPAPRPSSWASSPGPPWLPMPCKSIIPSPSVLRPGTTNRRRPSWMPSPWRAATCGWHLRVFHCRLPPQTYRNSLPASTTEWWIPSRTPLELRKA